jgi:hypothetical protein
VSRSELRHGARNDVIELLKRQSGMRSDVVSSEAEAKQYEQ